MSEQTNETTAERIAATRGSLEQVLGDNLGKQAVCEFWVGTQTLAEKRGTLVAVGDGTLALYDENAKSYLLCDTRGLRFATLTEVTAAPLDTETVPVPAPTASVRPASAQAAFNYAKRKARR